MSPLDLAKYERPLPRYTSYPTAPHFHPNVGPERYAAWLEALDPALPVSLYLHVPFCDSLCWFCGCTTKVVGSYDPVLAYVELLERELALLGRHLSGRRRLSHLHFGGGSPTLLRPKEVERIGRAVSDLFAPLPDAEIALEVDPRGLARETVAAFAALGVNRASLGMQDSTPEVQRAINRIQPFEVTRQAVTALRAAGIARINLDLMYGLPHQTRERLLRSVEDALALAPDRLALFGYAHVPHIKRHQRLLPEAALPDGAARLAQFQAAGERLVAAGYRWIGLDHFARPKDSLAKAAAEGRLRRNFQGYTSDSAPLLLGIGASAIGSLPQGYVQNSALLPQYRAAIGGGRLATVRGRALSPQDRLRRRVIERILCDLSVDLTHEAAAEDLSEDFETERHQLAPFAADGLLDLEGSKIRVSEKGRPLLRNIAAVFDSYLAPAEGRHSRAI